MTEPDEYQWESECWQCGEETVVVWPRGTHLDSEVGERLAEQTEYNVQKVFSKSLNKEVWGNTCNNCEAYQGNHFIRREALEQFASPVPCEVCGDEHEWYPDDGMGAAFGQGWIDCPEYGPVPVGEPKL